MSAPTRNPSGKQDPVAALRERVSLSPAGGYLFWGPEEYLKRFSLGLLRDAVQKRGLYELNRIRINAKKETFAEKLAEAVDAPPVLSDLRLVEVWDLELLSLGREGEEALCGICRRLPEDLILVLYFRETELVLDKAAASRKIVRELSESLTVVPFAYQSEAKLLVWLNKLFTREKLRVSDANLRKMIRFSSGGMSVLKSDAEKLIHAAQFSGRDEITEQDVEKAFRLESEYQVYELTDAVLNQNRAKSIEILQTLKRQRVDPLLISAALTRTFSNLLIQRSARKAGMPRERLAAALSAAPWQLGKTEEAARSARPGTLERAAALCLACDKKLKGARDDSFLLVEALTFSLLAL